jgi:hypothetical protein
VPDVSVDLKVPATDDARNVGAATTEENAPVPIVADAPEMLKPSAVDQVPIIPPSSRRG